MKDILKFSTKVAIVAVCLVFMANRDNMKQKRESIDITWCDTVIVTNVSYRDSECFRIKNTKDSSVWIKCVLSDRTDTLRWQFREGWNPEVVRAIITDATNSIDTIYIGK